MPYRTGLRSIILRRNRSARGKLIVCRFSLRLALGFSACAIKDCFVLFAYAPFTTAVIDSCACGLARRKPLGSLRLARFAPVGISRLCARLSYVAIVVHGSNSSFAPIAPAGAFMLELVLRLLRELQERQRGGCLLLLFRFLLI